MPWRSKTNPTFTCWVRLATSTLIIGVYPATVKVCSSVYLSFLFWDQTAVAANVHPPRAVFGLGLDVEDLDASFERDDVAVPAFPRPNTGLFITGTVDEIAPSQETMERVEGLGGLAWHWIHLRVQTTPVPRHAVDL